MVRPLGIDNIVYIAEKKGFICLSKEYKNNYTIMWFRCKAQNHRFHKTAQTLRKTKNCPKCIRYYTQAPYTIKDLQDYANSRGGVCKSKKYLGADKYYNFVCEKGHPFSVKWNALRNNNSWCSECAGNKKLTHESVKDFLKSVGYTLNSKYQNNRTPMDLTCMIGHDFLMSYSSIKRGRSCTVCNEFTGEKICRAYFNGLLNGNFKKVKPKWLLNDKGNKMELDGFDKELKIAFEFQGVQHYEHNNLFHQTRTLKQQKKDDKLKLKLVEKQGIKLISIYGYNKIDEKRIKKQILNRLKRKSITIVDKDFSVKDKSIFYNAEYLKQIKEHSIKYNFERTDETVIINKSTKFPVKCKKCDHSWKTTISYLNSGRSCRKCSGLLKKTTKEINEFVSKFSLMLHDDEYINQDTPHNWKCECGNIFIKKFVNLKRSLNRNHGGNSCDQCDTHWNKRDTNYFIKYIETKGYEYISGKFDTMNKSKFTIKCKKHGINEISAKYIAYAGGVCAKCKSEANQYTPEFLISELKRYHKEFGKIPTTRNINEAEGYPSTRPYQTHFGKNWWTTALSKAKLR